MNPIKVTAMAAGIFAALIFSGCKSSSEQQANAKLIATAELDPASGSNVHGTVSFIRARRGVRVEAVISGLAPGKHGFHVHESGDCSAPDASSAGGHFNPTGMPHGGPMADRHHIGDLGNLEAGSDGVAHYSRVFHDLSFQGTNSIVGKAIIVHAKTDDFTSQPSGNSGARVACGLIEMK